MNQRLASTFAALKADLIHEEGPRISTMRNYRFCIAVYQPREEFELRRHVQRLTSELVAGGWVVKGISLQRVLLNRLRSHGEHDIARIIQREKGVTAKNAERGLNFLKDKITPELEGPEGIAADLAKEIQDFIAANPDKAERTLVIIGRVGALYPFFRSSALLKHLDGHTKNVPVVLMYPGERLGETGLRFMGKGGADSDYRPRIYG
ncbi:MAG: DUF1788 domain-containing protein [Nannocystaceae bacterium]